MAGLPGMSREYIEKEMARQVIQHMDELKDACAALSRAAEEC
jgi:hypothetical protein